MPDLIKLLIKLVDAKGALYVAQELSHSDTSRVKRWITENKIPGTHKYSVFELLREEDLIV